MIRWLALVALFALSCAPPPAPPDGFVISGASVLDGGAGPARAVNVLVQGDTIVAVDEDAPDGIEIVDAGGLTLAPGFIDTHSHGDTELADHRGALAAVSQASRRSSAVRTDDRPIRWPTTSRT